jgi:16S rRNA (cytosine967-C5)-methyltransferase
VSEERGRGRAPSRANAGRIAAARALIAVEEGLHVEDVLAERAPSEGSDRRLAWHLALGVLRRRGQVDAALRTVITRPLASVDPEVLAVLRIGMFERLFSRTPPHAAVDQAVETVRSLGAGRASSMVNAVLRRAELPEQLDEADALDHPAWLLARWTQRYGADAARAWCVANGENPPLVISTRGDCEAVGEKLAAAGVSVHPVRVGGQLLERALRLEDQHGRVEELPGFFDGEWWVQDAASIAAAEMVPASAQRVLDACAAPGGKAFRLASRGAQVFAVDVNETRLQRVKHGSGRLKLKIPVRVHDWERGPLPGEERFDAVLVDAPCTGLGVVRRHPEIRWRRGPFDAMRVAGRQLRILQHAAPHVGADGALVYSVCSPEPEEGEQVISAFLASVPGWQLDHAWSSAPPVEGEDAFFAARLIRR